jgi:hypothetical protein
MRCPKTASRVPFGHSNLIPFILAAKIDQFAQ